MDSVQICFRSIEQVGLGGGLGRSLDGLWNWHGGRWSNPESKRLITPEFAVVFEAGDRDAPTVLG